MGQPIYIFCHGLNGYGQYDEKYKKKPCWGGDSGDVVAEWRSKGVEAYAASVASQGSAWDRACELYAQLAGTRVDYGKAHSSKYNHSRVGRDFSGCPLIPSWNDDTRIVLIGHSFGGATARLFAELLANGSPEERAVTPSVGLSPLFAGGMAERVFAIVTLAAPTNGSTAYELSAYVKFDDRRVKVSAKHKFLDRVMKRAARIRMDGRDKRDWASYDMLIDSAQALNARIQTLPHVYYLSVACDTTVPGDDGARVPDLALADPLFVREGTLIGCYSGKTAAGCVVDDAWHANDGLVNTISARAPFGAPQQPFNKDNVQRGIWNVMDDMHVDHGFFVGGFMHKSDPHAFYLDLLDLLQTLE